MSFKKEFIMKDLRIYLRAFEIEDYKLIHKWRNDDEITRNFGGLKLFTSSENEKKWVESKIFDRENTSCAICLKDSDEMIGCVFLGDINLINKTGHCPTFIGDNKHKRKGFATEARMLILKYAFFDRGLNRIWARILTDNIGSIKMVEKCGYKKEGWLRESVYKDGELKDEYLFAVLKKDFVKIWNDRYE